MRIQTDRDWFSALRLCDHHLGVLGLIGFSLVFGYGLARFLVQ
jgi:hypothetical protein